MRPTDPCRLTLSAPPTRQRGFTLIELVVAMTIIGILAAIAIPQYSEYIARSRRADAQAFLLDVAARQQHVLVDRRQYNDFKSGEANNVEQAVADGGLGMKRSTDLAKYYDITSTVVNSPNPAGPPSFTISAVPKAAQAGDRCGTLTIDQAGTRATIPPGITRCW